MVSIRRRRVLQYSNIWTLSEVEVSFLECLRRFRLRSTTTLLILRHPAPADSLSEEGHDLYLPLEEGQGRVELSFVSINTNILFLLC
jgi:hypothetical protein